MTRVVAILAGLAMTACSGSGPAPDQHPASASDQQPASASAGTDRPGEPSTPLAPEPPARRMVTVPAGTTLTLILETPVASDTSAVEDAVRATLRSPVEIDGTTVLPSGVPLTGVVSAVERSGRVKGRAFIALRFTTLRLDDASHRVHTAAITRRAQSTKAKDAKTIAIPAAGGAVVGGIVGGKKGAAIGGATGGGAGTAVVLTTRGEEVQLAAGTRLTTRLVEPMTVEVAEGSTRSQTGPLAQ